ncbi:MAG TPA: hypothetical protein VMW08_12865 [Acidimicrobiales bacterium]|nr:hypothetical protein [Acidimicrobiales bacterium]
MASSVHSLDSWTRAEERALRVEFRRGCSLDAIAASHGRAVHDVRARLVRIGEFERALQPDPEVIEVSRD